MFTAPLVKATFQPGDTYWPLIFWINAGNVGGMQKPIERAVRSTSAYYQREMVVLFAVR